MNTTLSTYEQLSEDYQRVEQAIAYLDANVQAQPTLKDIADHVGLSEYHFQRLFTRWVGISPKRFLQFLTKERAKAMLEASRNLLDVAYETGLSGPGRWHDLFVTCEAVTPGEYKARGAGLTIVYGFHPSPFGECLLALTGRGICGLAFVQHGDRQEALDELRHRWKMADVRESPSDTRPLVSRIFNPHPGPPPFPKDGNRGGETPSPVAVLATGESRYSTPGRGEGYSLPLLTLFQRGEAEGGGGSPLHLYLHGTNFQIKVWEALLRIPPGRLVSYEDIAAHLGMPNAARAVGLAVASNPIPVLIPCHRVIRKMGELGGYRYGLARKKAMLGWEMARWRSFRTAPVS